MIQKIIWPKIPENKNPFGGIDGYRKISLTFHSRSFTKISCEEKKALEILLRLADLEDVDALAFDDLVSHKIIIDSERTDNEYIELRISNSEGNIIKYSGISKSWLRPEYLNEILNDFFPIEGDIFNQFNQEILEIGAHIELDRDIFVTTSPFLFHNKNRFSQANIFTPKEALKIVGLYLRMRGEFEWTSHFDERARNVTSRRVFYDYLSKGMLTNCWKYLSGLGLHHKHGSVARLGRSVLDRFSFALQARDEIGRLFFLPKSPSIDDSITYHFDYLTLLLTGALDTQALIVNEIFNLGQKSQDCGFRRTQLLDAIAKEPDTKKLNEILIEKKEYIDILYKLRNFVHSFSLDSEIDVPYDSPNKLLDDIIRFDTSQQLGIQKRNMNLLIESKQLPYITYSIDKYSLACGLIKETSNLVNLIMEETINENILGTKLFSKVVIEPPPELLLFIETFLLLA